MKNFKKKLTGAVLIATFCVAGYADDWSQIAELHSDPIHEPPQVLLAQEDLARTKKKSSRESTSAKNPDSRDSTTDLPEMFVTGQELVLNPDYNVTSSSLVNKTDIPVMETPFSIQTVPQQVLRDQQVIRIEQALRNVSGVFQNNSTFLESADEFNIRGFRSGGILFRDGTRFNTTASGKRDPANLEQIEILKGPASFLFGRIEPGGLINLHTKPVLSERYYSFAQQFGSYDFYRTTFDGTGPITADNRLGYRLNLAYENSGSFREFISNQRYFVAPKFQINLTPSTQVNISLDHLQRWGNPDSVGMVALGTRPAPLPRGRNLGEAWSSFNASSDIVVETLTHEFNDQWKLQQIFNYSSADSVNNVVYADIAKFTKEITPDEPDPIQNGMLNRFLSGIDTNTGFSYYNALNLIGKVETGILKHNLLIGGDFYYNRTTDSIQGVKEDGSSICQDIAPINIFNPVHTGGGAPDFFAPGCLKQVFNNRASWFGLYFQDQIELPYNVFLLGGFRYDNAKFAADSLIANLPSKLHQTKVTPRSGLLWRPLPWLSLYGSYVQSLGAANDGSITSSGAAIAPETAEQWEGGFKTELFDGRFTGTFAYYDLTKGNVIASDPANPDVFSIPIGKANSHGVEVDFAGEPLPGWRIIANYAYTIATIIQGNGSSFPPVGSQLSGVPKHAGSFWNTYEVQDGVLSGLTVGGGAVMRGQRQGDLINSFQLPGYVTVDLMASYRMKVGRSNLSFQLNIENLLDKNYIASSADFARNRLGVGAPRTFLGMVRLEL